MYCREDREVEGRLEHTVLYPGMGFIVYLGVSILWFSDILSSLPLGVPPFVLSARPSLVYM